MGQLSMLGYQGPSDHEQLCSSAAGFSSHSRIHDTTQFESRFDFRLPQPSLGVDSSSYRVELFMFFPSQLNIDESTYPIESFYGDLTHLLRIRTPKIQDQLAPNLPSQDPTSREIRLFGCRVFSALQHLQEQWQLAVTTFASDNGATDIKQTLNSEQIAQFSVDLESIHKELRNFREQYLWNEDSSSRLDGLEADIRQSILLVDELLSYHSEQVMIKMLRHQADPGSGGQLLQNQLEAVLVGELAYRNQHISPRTGISTGPLPELSEVEQALNHEQLNYRLGIVKRYVFEILFVEGQRHRRDYLYRNIAAGFGAALAALFATVANIQIVHMLMNRDEGYLKVFLVMLLGTVAYIFKDRTKELTKDFVFSKIGRWLPDYERRLHYKLADSNGKIEPCQLGTSREYARYLNRNSIPQEILQVRNQGHRMDLDPERSEVILHYDKIIEFLPAKQLSAELEQAGIHSLTDILRLNVSKFLVKLHDPTQTKFFFDLETGIRQVSMPRVYHLNVVFRHTCVHNGKSTVQYERMRLILNKTGILRLESWPLGTDSAASQIQKQYKD
jgi:hypothetical protein